MIRRRGTRGKGRKIKYMDDKAIPPMLTCERCGHEWPFKGGELPDNCAKCKSNFWDTPPNRNYPGRKPNNRSPVGHPESG